MRHPFLMAAALFAASHWSAPPARGQDYCWDPIQVTDTGSWTLDNTNANPSGFMGCGMNMWRDVFYQWTVPRTGGYVFETCGTVGDTIMALYSGEGCTATCLRFNDDYCGTSSQIQFGQLTEGDKILIQVGAKDFQTDIVGEFTIRCATASNDDCANPMYFWGDGAYQFDTGCATTSGIDSTAGTLCDGFTIHDDVFFLWTPTYSGSFYLATQSSDPTADTLLRVYRYTDCGNLVCVGSDDDDGPGNLSQVHLPVVPLGFQYLVQVGMKTPGTGGAGVLVVDDDPCSVLTSDAFAPNQHCWTAAPIDNGSYANLATGPSEPDYYELTIPAGETALVQTVTDSFPMPLGLALYDPGQCPSQTVWGCANSLACGQTVSPNTAELVYANGTGAPKTVKLRVMPPPGTTCLSYTLFVGGLDGGTTQACTPAYPNSTGMPCTLAPSSFSGPELFHLEAAHGPPDQFAYFVVSGNLVPNGVPVSQGLLCLGAPLGRYNAVAATGNAKRNSVGRFNDAGILINLMGTSSTNTGFDVPTELPAPPGGIITAGQTWHFQLWYRDGVVSNFSDVLSVTF